MSGICDVLDNTDLLEEILVRVPRESIFNCIIVSKCWFDLISGPCFRDRYIKRRTNEAVTLLLRLRSGEQFDVSTMKNRIQAQQLAALEHLQRELAAADLPSSARLDRAVTRIRTDRAGVLSALRAKLPLDGGETGADLASVGLEPVNELLRARESEVLNAARESLEQLPSQRMADVNEMQYQIASVLLFVMSQAQCQLIWNSVVEVLLRNQVATAELMAELVEYLATAAAAR